MIQTRCTERDFEEHIVRRLCESGYRAVSPDEYDRSLCLIPSQLMRFISETQPKSLEKLELQYGADTEAKLAKRISNEIESRGVIDVLRKGVKDRGAYFRLVYFEPKSGMNPEHRKLYEQNRLITIRQLKYSRRNENSIDIGIFVNGIPITMLELKNTLTGQNHDDGRKQWKCDRNPKEALFRFKRNLAYFAVGNEKVSMATRLNGTKTRFLPFNQGIENPVYADGHKTHYLWDEILQPDSVLDLVENFVHVREEVDQVYDAKKMKVVKSKREVLIFPRFHQINVIRKLKKAIIKDGPGQHYLIQHATGSGKSLSIGWLSHLLSSLHRSSAATNRIFDSVVVVTDRRVLDKQLRNTTIQLEQTQGVVNPVEEDSQQLKRFLEQGKAIILTTVQKFPFISKTISKMQNKTFGVVVDEVHSSQGGESATHLRKTLSDRSSDASSEDEGHEDLTEIDKPVLDEIRSRGKQPNVSFFGFSGTPKNKTLETFGTKTENGFVAFDVYSMEQSIAEGFTLDVLKSYITYERCFKINKTIKEDRELPESRAKSMLMRWVDDHPHNIREKSKIILQHFKCYASEKISGKARGMLVTRSRASCVKYKLEFDKQMKEMNLDYGVLVGFSGSVAHEGKQYTEAGMNGFPERHTEEKFKDPKFRILIVNNKFQTGFDEPMLHTMYVDKPLRGLQCVQTLSRLNRTMAGKTGTFVLDFVNEESDVLEAFQPYFQSTSLAKETDPNCLYRIEQEIKEHNLFQDEMVEQYAKIFYGKDTPMEALQAVLDTVAEAWRAREEEEREKFRGEVQSFIRLYAYVSQIITFEDVLLEKLYVFLYGLSNKLPRRKQEELKELYSSVELESLRIEKRHSRDVQLEKKIGELRGVHEGSGAYLSDESKDFLSEVIRMLNERYDGDFTDEDRVPLEKVDEQLRKDEELKRAMEGDNSETNKKAKFDEILGGILAELATEHLDFYNKIYDHDHEKIRFLKKQMFAFYQRSMRSDTRPSA